MEKDIIFSTDPSWLIWLRGNLKHYLTPDSLPWFIFAGANRRISSAHWGPIIETTIGIGYGRFRNITPLAKAKRINHRLLKQESISAPLCRIDLLSMAVEIACSLDRPIAEILKELEDIIEASLLVKPGGLDARDIFKMGKIIEDKTYFRFSGGEVKIGPGYEIFDPFGGPKDLLITVASNYALPLSPWAQFLARSKASGTSDVLDTHRLEISLSYELLVDERMSFLASYVGTRETQEGSSADTHDLSLEMTFVPIRDIRATPLAPVLIHEAKVTLGLWLRHEPRYLGWRTDIAILLELKI